MPYILNCIQHIFKLRTKYIGLLLLFIIVFFSCNKPQSEHLTGLAYDKVLDSASHTYDANKPQQALHYLDSATKNYSDLTPRQWFTYYTYHYNYYYFIQDDKDTAMLYADSMLRLFDTPAKRLKYTSEIGQADFYKAGIYFDQGKYEQAYQYYYQGKLIASNNVDDCTLSDYNYRLGMIMYKQEHYYIAVGYFKSSLYQANKCDMTYRSFLRRQELFNNTGLCYGKINKGDSALVYFNKGLKFIDNTGARFTAQKEDLNVCRGVIYGNMANIYIKRKKYQLAEDLLNKSIKINLRPNNDNKDAQLSELKLAHLYEQQNRNESLINLLQHISTQFDTIKNKDAEADWNLLMANYYTKKGRAQTAFKYLVKNAELKDSILNRDKKLKEADISQQMEKLKKNHEFDTLKKSNTLQQYYLKTIIVLALMLLLIIFLVYRNWQKSKKNIRTLGGLNNKINEQNFNLEYALAELRLSGREKDRILRNVAHDLRNPLGGVASLTGLMLEENEYTDEQKELINLIKETSNNSLELINEILEATHTITTKTNKDKEPVEINALINNSIELLRFKAAEKKQQITFDGIETPVELYINREQIWRVASNLISNAIKFSPENGLIRVKLTDEGKIVKIAVADNGIGIPDNLKEAIFNMFTDAKRPGTAGEKSFGLGLSICRQIIENHGGEIWFDSDGKTGTTFYVILNKPV